jgi:hypothetical protein
MATSIPPTGADYDGAVTAKSTGGFAVTVGVTFGTTGTVTNTGTGSAIAKNWFVPNSAVGASYWVRATLTSGDVPTSGTMNTWLQLNASRSWANAAAGGRNLDSFIKFEIASDAGGVNIVYTGTIEINADGTL